MADVRGQTYAINRLLNIKEWEHIVWDAKKKKLLVFDEQT